MSTICLLIAEKFENENENHKWKSVLWSLFGQLDKQSEKFACIQGY